MTGTRVVVVGDVFDDLIVTPAGEIRPDTDTSARIQRRDGGSAANAAAWFGSLGHETHFFGRVGRADAARHSLSLAAHGVEPHLVADAELVTGTIVVVLEADRTRTMLTDRGANALASPDDVDRGLLVPGSHLHLTAYTLFPGPGVDEERRAAAFAAVIAAARQSGATVSVNPGSAGFIADHGAAGLLAATAGATIAVPNLDEGRLLTGRDEPGDVLDALLEHYEVVALTLGRAGALGGTRRGARARTDAVPVDPVDTTGAGDAFGAAFTSALVHASVPVPEAGEQSLHAALTAGARTAAVAITRVGARPPLDTTTTRTP
ncbi:PfkB family carbohydrate kinase [Herbiconiux moechotypicola]|uniref:PfkB family carbohydrate kinase n=1 Tax=Herbiconiux moechotypicola TaxID=637393 RepID=A0ABN3D7A5_9MICO|nr:PfkB family carbohydrate kinase [Herbiconiux moechotypicola]MCS5728460.1 PfkB family carbohydrate kinase [Herbiconiux moechotypicola]